MMRVANAPMFNPKQNGWLNCADAVPSDNTGYVFVPAASPPYAPNLFLTIDASGNLTMEPKGEQAGVSTQYFQLSGNFLVAEMNGPSATPCIPGVL